MKRLAPLLVETFSVLALLATVGACSESNSGVATGGSAPIGGLPATGGTSGNTSQGGTSTGGVATGGVSTGGTASGGAATGGVSTGGAANGGSANGGTATGGINTGGASTGGTPTGGAGPGGGGAGGTTGTASPLANFATATEIVVNKCHGSGCHGGETPPTLLDDGSLYTTLTTYVSKRCGNRVLVKPGSPQESSFYLVQKGECGPGGVSKMPFGCVDDCTPAEYIEGVRQWIANGAAK